MDNRCCVMPEKEINQIKEKFISKLSPVKIYLFGSFANGTANDDSDFDFYIIVNDDTQNLVDLTAEAYKSIRSVRSRAVDIVIGTESRFESRKNKSGIKNSEQIQAGQYGIENMDYKYLAEDLIDNEPELFAD